MSAKFKKVGYGFLLRWILATVVGFLVSLHWVEIGARSDLGFLQGALGGAVVGIAQYLVLRHRIQHLWIWVLASILGWSILGYFGIGALGWVAPRGMYDLSSRLTYGFVEGIRVGAVLGILQWLVLTKQVPNAWHWVVASTAGWSIGLAAGWAIGAVLRLKTGIFLGEVGGLVLAWVVMSGITGVSLTELLQREPRKIALKLRYSNSK